MKNSISILLLIGIILLLNLLSKQFFFRLDMTQDKQYTLSKATKNILESLEDPVTVTAYFTENLPPQLLKVRNDFSDMLIEYSAISKGMVNYEFISPNGDPELEQAAAQSGIQPVPIQVREKDQIKQQNIFIGAVIKIGEQQDIIPVIQSGAGMEYALSTGIKKLSVIDKPSVALLQGYGMPPVNELGQVYQSLSILYNVEPVDLSAEEGVADRFRAVALINPKDSLPPAAFAKLDAYLNNGGKLCIAFNTVDGDFSTAQGTATNTGLEDWLKARYELEVENSFLIDASCGSVTVQQKQGFFNFQNQVQFPFLPLISTFPEHPINKGVEQVVMVFASPMRYLGDTSAVFTPIATSSPKAGIIQPPTVFDVSNKKWTASDFPMSEIIVGGVLEGKSPTGVPYKLVVFSDGDFPVSGEQGRGQGQDNINLMVNSIDWLSDDTGLIDLRTKGVATRPIAELEDADRSFWKWFNFFVPLLMVFVYGFYRWQGKRAQRERRRNESYA